MEGSPMTSLSERDDIFIERHNILRYSDLLATEIHPAMRATLLKLLAEERAKLESHNRKSERIMDQRCGDPSTGFS